MKRKTKAAAWILTILTLSMTGCGKAKTVAKTGYAPTDIYILQQEDGAKVVDRSGNIVSDYYIGEDGSILQNDETLFDSEAIQEYTRTLDIIFLDMSGAHELDRIEGETDRYAPAVFSFEVRSYPGTATCRELELSADNDQTQFYVDPELALETEIFSLDLSGSVMVYVRTSHLGQIHLTARTSDHLTESTYRFDTTESGKEVVAPPTESPAAQPTLNAEQKTSPAGDPALQTPETTPNNALIIFEDEKEESEAAQEQDEDPNLHAHHYSRRYIKPTTSEGGYWLYTCTEPDCGKTYKGPEEEPPVSPVKPQHVHDYDYEYRAEGKMEYIHYTCTACGDEYDQPVSAKTGELQSIQEQGAKYIETLGYIPEPGGREHLPEVTAAKTTDSAELQSLLQGQIDRTIKEIEDNYNRIERQGIRIWPEIWIDDTAALYVITVFF